MQAGRFVHRPGGGDAVQVLLGSWAADPLPCPNEQREENKEGMDKGREGKGGYVAIGRSTPGCALE